MKMQINIALIAVLMLGLLLGMAVSARAGREKELTVCRFEVSLDISGTLYTALTVRSSGDIAGSQGELSVSDSRHDAGPDDAEAAATAFAELAKSFPCAVGSLQDWPVGGENAYAVQCVCQGTRDKLISVTGKMMKFAMTSPETP
jgi:hypothetical protein